MSSHPTPQEKQTLLIPTKRPLHPPSKATKSLNPSSTAADIQKASSDSLASDARTPGSWKTVEVDFSRAPQPFLDPGVWKKMREGEKKEEGESSASATSGREFGGMAVKGRKAVRKMR